MPNPKNSKGGRKNKRANSSGDEQENGAGALAAAGAAGAAAGGALAAAGCGAAAAAGAPGTGGAAGTGGAGTGAATAAANAAAGAAAAGDCRNGKTGRRGDGAGANFLPDGDGAVAGRRGARAMRGQCASQEVRTAPLRPAAAAPAGTPSLTAAADLRPQLAVRAAHGSRAPAACAPVPACGSATLGPGWWCPRWRSLVCAPGRRGRAGEEPPKLGRTIRLET